MFDEARAIVSSHDAGELSSWFAWRDDWSDWQPVDQVTGLTETIYRQMSATPPEAPGQDGAFRVVTGSGDGGPAGLSGEFSLSISTVSPPGELSESTNADFVVRNKKRYKKRYSVSIELEGKVFKTWTRDISVGGLYVEDMIPDWVTGYFKVRIGKSTSKQQIELQCCLVEQQKPTERFRMMILPLQNPNDEQNLEAWIAA